jgi:hypothetical protein
MRNRVKIRALPALSVFFIMAMPLFAESCALAHGGYGGSGWKRCPKARECPPTPLVERDKRDLNTGWLSTANGLPTRNVHTTEASALRSKSLRLKKPMLRAVLSLSQDRKLV